MKGGRSATQDERNYAFRRVIYNLMLASESLQQLRVRSYSPTIALTKIAALIIARNLNDFLYFGKSKYNDDIFFSDFGIGNWSPDQQAQLSVSTRDRIHKISAHIVCEEPAPFDTNRDVRVILRPLVVQSVGFIRECIKQQKAEFTGNAQRYAKELNTRLRRLKLSPIPIPR